jgi:hypothetical protein
LQPIKNPRLSLWQVEKVHSRQSAVPDDDESIRLFITELKILFKIRLPGIKTSYSRRSNLSLHRRRPISNPNNLPGNIVYCHEIDTDRQEYSLGKRKRRVIEDEIYAKLCKWRAV